MKQLFFFLPFLLLTSLLSSQPKIEWDKRFGGSGVDLTWGNVFQTSDGGYIVAGTSNSEDGDKSDAKKPCIFGMLTCNDFWIVKMDANGNKEWDRTYGGSRWDQLFYMEQTSDGGYILEGGSNSPMSFDKSQHPWNGYGYQFDAWLLKIDANGNKEWDRRYGGYGYDGRWNGMVHQTPDNGYIMGVWIETDTNTIPGGNINVIGYGLKDFWAVKTNSVGVIQWNKVFGTGAYDDVYSIECTLDGGYIISGSTDAKIAENDLSQTPRGYSDYWILKMDASGNKQWDKRFGGNRSESLGVIKQTSDSGYVIAGSSWSLLSGDKTETNRGGGDYWVVKTDKLGNKIWDHRYGGLGNDDNVSDIYQMCDGGYVLIGTTEKGLGGDKTVENYSSQNAALKTVNYWMIRLNSDGALRWQKLFGTLNDKNHIPITDLPHDDVQHDSYPNLNLTKDGGFIFAGSVNSGIGGDKTQPSRGSTDYWVVKFGYEADFKINNSIAAIDTICRNNTEVFNNTSFFGPGDSIYWNWNFGDPASGSANTSNVLSPSHHYLTAGTYTVTLTAQIDCMFDTVYKVVYVKDSVDGSATNNATICFGADVQLQANGGDTYEWSPSAGLSSNTIASPTANPDLTTNYEVIISNPNACGADTLEVMVTVADTLNSTVSPDTTVWYGSPIQLLASGGDSYLWAPAKGLSCIDCPNPMANPEETTTYYVSITDSFGCTVIKPVTIEIRCGKTFVPTAFSPNDDGQNDVLEVKLDCIESMELIIFDRWGNKIFETNDLLKKWNGKDIQGVDMETAVFAYKLTATFIDKNIIYKNGNISLIK